MAGSCNATQPPGGSARCKFTNYTYLLVQGRDDAVRLPVDELDAILVVRELDERPLDLFALVLLLKKPQKKKRSKNMTERLVVFAVVSSWGGLQTGNTAAAVVATAVTKNSYTAAAAERPRYDTPTGKRV